MLSTTFLIKKYIGMRTTTLLILLFMTGSNLFY